MDVENVARAVVFMASRPVDANVPFLTVMATKMPFVGWGCAVRANAGAARVPPPVLREPFSLQAGLTEAVLGQGQKSIASGVPRPVVSWLG
jgi:hypothetical protein